MAAVVVVIVYIASNIPRAYLYRLLVVGKFEPGPSSPGPKRAASGARGAPGQPRAKAQAASGATGAPGRPRVLGSRPSETL